MNYDKLSYNNTKSNNNVSVAEAKSHFSEYISKVAYSKKRYTITKRNKPVAALIPVEELAKLESREELDGLITLMGKWRHIDEILPHIEKVYKERSTDRGRNVSL